MQSQKQLIILSVMLQIKFQPKTNVITVLNLGCFGYNHKLRSWRTHGAHIWWFTLAFNPHPVLQDLFMSSLTHGQLQIESKTYSFQFITYWECRRHMPRCPDVQVFITFVYHKFSMREWHNINIFSDNLLMMHLQHVQCSSKVLRSHSHYCNHVCNIV